MPDSSSIVASLYAMALGGTGGSNYVTLEWPALPVDAARYGNIWATDNQTGSPEALEAFSGLVDGLPALGAIYQPSGLTLSQVYGLLLEATTSSAAAAHVFTAAQETFKAVTRGSLETPELSFHPSWPTPPTWCDPTAAGLWTKVAIQPNDAAKPPPAGTPPPVLAVLQRPELTRFVVQRSAAPATRFPATPPSARPFQARAATAILRPSNQLFNAQAVTARQTNFADAATRIMQRPGAQPVIRPLASATPRPTLATLAPGPHGDDTPGRIPMGQRVPSEPVSPGHIRFPPIFPTGPAMPPIQTEPVSATKVGVSFEYIRVLIRRPWLDATMFHLPGWSLDGLAPGSVSTGSASTNPGMMPLLPTAFIAIRNVQVSGQWSDTDRQSIGGALTGGGVAALGPFTLSSDGGALGGFNGSTLSLPGVFVIAWECALMPLLPPS